MQTQGSGPESLPRLDATNFQHQGDALNLSGHEKAAELTQIEGQHFRDIKRVHSDGHISLGSARSGMQAINNLSFPGSPTTFLSQASCRNATNVRPGLVVPEAKFRRILRQLQSKCKNLRGTRAWHRLAGPDQTYRCSTPTAYRCYSGGLSSAERSSWFVAFPASSRTEDSLSRSDSGASARRNCQLA